MWSYLPLVALICSSASAAQVPQVQICTGTVSECPYVSRIGLGTLHLGNKLTGILTAEAVNAWILRGVELGINLFDLADVYPVVFGEQGHSAELFGEALALTPGLREQLILVAKIDIVFSSQSLDTMTTYLSEKVDWFLTTLGTTHLDIMLIHYSDSFMNADTVAALFQDLKSSGKVKHFGVSNHFPSKFDLLEAKCLALPSGPIKLVTNEFEASVWNPGYMNYNSELVDHAYKKGLRVLAWGALAGDPIGLLNRLFVQTGERQTKILKELRSVGTALGITQDTVVALVWLLDHPSGFIPLIGTTNLEHLEQQVTAMNYLGRMNPQQWWAIGAAGGLCSLGDSQCNYELYSTGGGTGTTTESAAKDCDTDSEVILKSTLGNLLLVIVCVQFVMTITLLTVFYKKMKASSVATKELAERLTTNPSSDMY